MNIKELEKDLEFIKHLFEDEGSLKMKSIATFDEDFTYRGFKHIKVGDISLSIQASYGNYCTPRKTLKNLNEYTSMEFALIGEEGRFLNVNDVLPNFEKLDIINEYFDGSVYSYVPVELIEELYNEFVK